jgi:membrane protein DedA with SNARE-associated domain
MSHLGIPQIIQFVERYGYTLLFLWVLAEQGAVPVPSVPLLIVVGTLVRIGHLHPAAAIACCVAGALSADSVWFYLGRHRGKKVLRFFCRVSLEPDSCVRRTENAFLKYGLNTLLIAKFIPGLNAVAAPLAGSSGIGLFRFLAVDALGVVIWSSAYIGVGYLFSDQLERALSYAQKWGSGFAAVIVVLFTAWIVWKIIQRRRFLRSLEADRITAEELHDRIDAGEDFYIVDLRSKLANDVSSVPGALRMTAEDLTARSKDIPRNKEIVLLCS